MINIQNVSMHYGSTQALKDVSFAVEDNEILGLLGPNGAGKSTLMKILTTYIVPSSGTATLGGFDILGQPLQVRAIVGYLPETVPLYPEMRVDEYLAFVGVARGLNGASLRQRLNWLIDTCGLAAVWKHNMPELSKGFQQRVGLAQALIHDPRILILDEPTSGLDPVQIISIRKLIMSLAKTKTVIFSTHILQEVEAIARRIVIINEGRIVSQGTRPELAALVSRQKRFRISVQHDAGQARQVLAQIPGVQQVELREEAAGLAGFIVRGDGRDDGLWQRIDERIKEQRWPLKMFAEEEYSLEDLFVALLEPAAGQGKGGAA